MSPPRPIKRHPVLQPLSREHMSGLVQARNLVRAAGADAVSRRAAITAFAHAWRTEIADHFDDEEELLVGLLLPAARDRLFNEHHQLRSLARDVIALTDSADPNPALLGRLGELLHDHIRWEERHAFIEAERAATPADLDRLSQQAAAIEARRPGSRARLRL